MNLLTFKPTNMKKRGKRFYFIPFIILGVVAVLSGLVMLLWNNVVTGILNVKDITYWQALGLFILCKILFTSFRPGPPAGFRKGGPPWRNKLMDMTESERELFKKEWQKRNAGRDEPGQ
jgi:hypothetical protein